MSNFIEHSDNWNHQPPVPPKLYKGWWVSNDDGEPMHGPFEVKKDAEDHLTDIDKD